MANKPTFEDFFTLKEPMQVLEEVQKAPTKELNGVHKEISLAQTVVLQTHENGKDDAIQRLQNTIEELAAKIQPQQPDFAPLLEAFKQIQAENQPVFQEELLATLKTLQLFQAKVEQKLDLLTRQQTKKQPEPTQGNEALEKLQTHSLYLAKIEQKLEVLNRTQQKNQVPSTSNEALEKLQTHSLYLAKIEQKLEVLSRTQQAQAKVIQPPKEDTNEKWQTHSLYLAKMEQKLELIQRQLQKMQLPQKQEVDNEKWQTNNLYLAKIDQKLELLSRIQQKLQAAHKTPDANETAEKLQTNNLFLAKIEQKLELISRTQQKSNLPTQAKQDFTQIEAQLQSLTDSIQNNQPKEEPQAHQVLLEKLQGYQNTLTTIEENIQSMQENVLQLQHNQVKISESFIAQPASIQPNLESILPAPEFWDKLHLIMERNETQIKEIRQVIEAITQPTHQQEQPNSTDAILSGLHTNNVYLAKMEQRLETLNKALEKVVQKKT